jgi:phosphoserine aminotransferase
LANRRAEALYSYIDSSNGFYTNLVDKKYRSKINVPFRISSNLSQGDFSSSTYLESKFLEFAASEGCV